MVTGYFHGSPLLALMVPIIVRIRFANNTTGRRITPTARSIKMPDTMA
jgi:hypothetical protein